MASEYNCTQFTIPYPGPKDGVPNYTILLLIDSIVTAYRPFHYYVFISILVFSFFANILIVIVLSKKEMRIIGVNVTMLLIGVCDFGCSVSAIGQLVLRNFSNDYSSYLNAYSQLACDYLTVAFHASSLYLATGMAFCRIMSLSMSNRNRNEWKSPSYAIRVSIVLCSPVFLLALVALFVNSVKQDDDGIYIDISDLSIQYGCFFLRFSFILAGSCFKAIPCLSMLILSLLLLARIDDGKSNMKVFSTNQKDKNSKIDRSSRFIQIVLIVFLVTESPQGLFTILGGLFIVDYVNYYQHLSVFMNVLAVFNTTTSFIIYSALSSKFRKLFVQLFLPTSIGDKIYTVLLRDRGLEFPPGRTLSFSRPSFFHG